MSQHIFKVSAADDVIIECMVGWDEMLQTFFGQVYRVDARGERLDRDEHERPTAMLSVGTTPCEICTIDQLRSRLKGFTDVPDDIVRQLQKIEFD